MKLTKKIEDMTLQELFQVVLEQYTEVEGTKYGSENPIYSEWIALKTKIFTEIEGKSGLDFANTYRCDMLNGKAKCGTGKWSKVFYAAILSRTHKSTQTGVYITYLFNAETQCVYLCLVQGANEFDMRGMKAFVADIRKKLNLSGFETSDIDCGDKYYDAGVIAHIPYTLATLPNDAKLYDDLRRMEGLYQQYLSLAPAAAPTAAAGYTDEQLCAILKKMLREAERGRKNAAIAIFGILYGEYINSTNRPKLVKATNGSNNEQMGKGLSVYNLLQKDESINVFEVEDARTIEAADLKAELEAKQAEGAKEATAIVFGIQNSKTIAENKIRGEELYGDGGLISLGTQIADLLEKQPELGAVLTPAEAAALPKSYGNVYTEVLLESKNIIFRGAPGTGKTYLARELAADLISGGMIDRYELLSDAQKAQVGFVQFHPSYDYSDFVEGLRPQQNPDGSMGFALKDGIFKRFADVARSNPDQPYVFIIDEINRGEISKILGELFFAIDPGYRGRKGEVATQYSYLHPTDEKFYIPENLYMIGTMNDIDRSVDTFDFAMRRRFRFIEIKASARLEMLNSLGEPLKTEAEARMERLNKAIAAVDGLNENYQIGAAYFLKLKHLTFEQLWSDYLQPLLQEYVNGMSDEAEIMRMLYAAYESKPTADEGTSDEATED